MQRIEKQAAIPSLQSPRESTHILMRGGRNGSQQYFDRGCGRIKNTEYEILHHRDC